jgi:hypothetical protein
LLSNFKDLSEIIVGGYESTFNSQNEKRLAQINQYSKQKFKEGFRISFDKNN